MQKTVTEIQAIFLPATNEDQKNLFYDHQLGTMAILCAVFSHWICLGLVLHQSKITLVFQFL